MRTNEQRISLTPCATRSTKAIRPKRVRTRLWNAQALAELAQVEGARGDAGFGSASALRYALRAAAACSRFFAVQEACLPEALFPAPVIRQMMTAASELNLALPAVVLSQVWLAQPLTTRSAWDGLLGQ